ncbi:MAG: phosphate signaling complex protein PhoU [Janthinobacterium lividum]
MISTVLPPHTVSSYDHDLHVLRSIVGQMGALSESQLTAALDAVAERDGEAAAAVVALDSRIDALQNEAERAAVSIFSRHSPLADDLREVLAAFKIAGWLERVGDYAKNIARRAAVLAELPEVPLVEDVERLGDLAKHLLRTALAAHLDRDLELAAEVVSGDISIDAEYEQLFGALVASVESDPGSAAATTHLQLVAKTLERIADQATNIAEQVTFAVTGAPIPPRGRTTGA